MSSENEVKRCLSLVSVFRPTRNVAYYSVALCGCETWSVTLTKEQSWGWMFQNRVMKKEVKEGWIKLD